MSSLHSRQVNCTSLAPNLLAVKATSTATLPPPITMTLSVTLTSSPRLTFLRKSRPQRIFGKLEPSTLSFLVF
ncbi:hypothetical protein ES703_56159 [subsurface metagenome]